MNQRRDDIAIYQTPDGVVTLDVRLESETVWLTQKQMAMLFDTERSVITKHLRNVFRSEELYEKSVCAKFAHTEKAPTTEYCSGVGGASKRKCNNTVAAMTRINHFLPVLTLHAEKTCCSNPLTNATPHPPRDRGGSLPRLDFHRVFLAALRDARIRKERSSLPNLSSAGRVV